MVLIAYNMHYNSQAGNPPACHGVPFLVVPEQPIEKVADEHERLLGSFTVGHVANARQNGSLNRAKTFPPRHLELLERAVLILIALHDQDRHTDIGELFGDVPLAEFRIEPRFTPRAEGAIDVHMPAAEFGAKASGRKRVASTPDFFDPHVLGKEMRRQ